MKVVGRCPSKDLKLEGNWPPLPTLLCDDVSILIGHVFAAGALLSLAHALSCDAFRKRMVLSARD